MVCVNHVWLMYSTDVPTQLKPYLGHDHVCCLCKVSVAYRQALGFYLNTKQGNECMLGYTISNFLDKWAAGGVKGPQVLSRLPLDCVEACPSCPCPHDQVDQKPACDATLSEVMFVQTQQP